MSEAYRRAGVDLEAAADAVGRIRDIALAASRPEVLEGVGGFAGLYDLGDGRLLAAATDGVGTKTEIARELGRLDTIGIDLVAMCANDVVCTGAEPIFFLDYVAVGKVQPDEIADLVAGVAEGCRRAGCALLGGETAEHPGVMEPGTFDLAGFCVGTVERDRMLGPSRVEAGDLILGLPSNGLHANGFSLVRRLLAEHDIPLDADVDGRSLGEALLEPTTIYVSTVIALAERGIVRSAAHVTGGGILENLPRALPEGLGAALDRSRWEVPPVLGFLQEAGRLADADMTRTFNMGLGMLLVVGHDDAEDAASALETEGVRAVLVGEVVDQPGVRL